MRQPPASARPPPESADPLPALLQVLSRRPAQTAVERPISHNKPALLPRTATPHRADKPNPHPRKRLLSVKNSDKFMLSTSSLSRSQISSLNSKKTHGPSWKNRMPSCTYILQYKYSHKYNILRFGVFTIIYYYFLTTKMKYQRSHETIVQPRGTSVP